MALLCLECRDEFEDVPEGYVACPGCGARGVPADTEQTVTVTITKHELRILTFWAANFAAANRDRAPEMPAIVQGIVDELGKSTDVALSLSQEITDLRRAFPKADVRVFRSDGLETDL